MPYIKADERLQYDELVDELAARVSEFSDFTASSNAGQLNYIITTLLLKTYNGTLPNYTDYNEIIGILECAKMEMYRRQTAPYEDDKIEENGDV